MLFCSGIDRLPREKGHSCSSIFPEPTVLVTLLVVNLKRHPIAKQLIVQAFVPIISGANYTRHGFRRQGNARALGCGLPNDAVTPRTEPSTHPAPSRTRQRKDRSCRGTGRVDAPSMPANQNHRNRCPANCHARSGVLGTHPAPGIGQQKQDLEGRCGRGYQPGGQAVAVGVGVKILLYFRQWTLGEIARPLRPKPARQNRDGICMIGEKGNFDHSHHIGNG
jgi:hypothetical protein